MPEEQPGTLEERSRSNMRRLDSLEAWQGEVRDWQLDVTKLMAKTQIVAFLLGAASGALAAAVLKAVLP